LWAQKGKLITRAELAREAIYVEQQLLGENVGCQDQVAVAYVASPHRLPRQERFHCFGAVAAAN